MDILGGGPTSLLLDHLLIPAGAKLKIQVDLLAPLIESHTAGEDLPRSLSNLRKIFNFVEIRLSTRGSDPRVRFSGLNGQVTMVIKTPQADTTRRVYEFLARFDTSEIERLTIIRGDLWDGCHNHAFYRALYPMKGLRTLRISQCKNIFGSISILDDHVICPKLEELFLDPRVLGGRFSIKTVVRIAEERASSGVKLKSVKIASRDDFARTYASQLEEYVSHVECGHGIARLCGGDDSSDDGESDDGESDDGSDEEG